MFKINSYFKQDKPSQDKTRQDIYRPESGQNFAAVALLVLVEIICEDFKLPQFELMDFQRSKVILTSSKISQVKT